MEREDCWYIPTAKFSPMLRVQPAVELFKESPGMKEPS